MKIIVIDIETLGLKISDMIVEIGVVSLDLSNGKIKKVFQCICNESKKDKINENSWIFQNSTLTFKEVKEAKNLLDYFNEIQLIFNKYKAITSFNQKFDLVRLHNRGFKIPKRIFDSMIVLTDIMKLPSKYYGYKYPSVKEAYNYFFSDKNNPFPISDYIEKHRAIDDCYHEAKIFYETFKLLNSNYLKNKNVKYNKIEKI